MTVVIILLTNNCITFVNANFDIKVYGYPNVETKQNTKMKQ
jgi:hypothetical protein